MHALCIRIQKNKYFLLCVCWIPHLLVCTFTLSFSRLVDIECLIHQVDGNPTQQMLGADTIFVHMGFICAIKFNYIYSWIYCPIILFTLVWHQDKLLTNNYSINIYNFCDMHSYDLTIDLSISSLYRMWHLKRAPAIGSTPSSTPTTTTSP